MPQIATPYQNKNSKQVVNVTDVHNGIVSYRPWGTNRTVYVSAYRFLRDFEQVREAPQPKGWDEEL